MEFIQNILNILFEYKTSFILIVIALIIESTARFIKNKNKKWVLTKYGESIDQENNEYYLQYYQKNQIIDFIRVITALILIGSLFAVNTDVGLGFFAVATGAFVMAFKDFLLSIIAFFFVTPGFHIGTTVKVAWVQGQIIFIRMLAVWILGRDDHGENTWELFLVPSNKFITDVVEKEDLRTSSILRDKLIIPYHPESFTIGFEEFLSVLRPFLQEIFPVRNANNIWNFPSYTGHRYKMDFDYHDEKYIAVTVYFIGKISENKNRKEKIIGFVDSYMKR